MSTRGYYPGVKAAGREAIPPYLVQWIRMTEAIPLLRHKPSWWEVHNVYAAEKRF